MVKSDGLAAGKGVTICENKDDAIKDIKIFLMENQIFKKVIVEEFLDGEEASYFVITDGTNLNRLEQPKTIKSWRRRYWIEYWRYVAYSHLY